MFWFIEQVFIALLNFSWSLATKRLSLNNEPYMIRPAIINLSPVELKYYPFMISLDKCNRICNAVDDLSTKTWAPIKTKYVNVKVFNIIAGITKAKRLIEDISCDCKCKIDSTICNSKSKVE